ncbi:hypothetical protein BGZ49_000573 [Haplosporangium sp. Z 27]|nr:hypothetical protein BGZ49_000573 [Haplosporangium sp. Z 27]
MTRKFVQMISKGSVDLTSASTSTSTSISETSSQVSSSVSADRLGMQFEQDFDAFDGQPWMLKSGSSVDEVLYKYVLTMSKQSSLHSSVIDSRDWPTYEAMFSPEDRQEMKERFHQTSLPEKDYLIEKWQRKVIDFFKSPDSIKQVYRKGWDNVFAMEDPEPEGYEDFSSFVINFMSDVSRFYKQFGREIGQEFELCKSDMSEKNFMTLWSTFFNALWINGKVMKYSDGEITSSASTYRRNGIRSLKDSQSRGHKIDGVLTAARADSEIGAVEGGKKNEGSYGTKYLTDGVKIAKAMKDMFDIACTEAAKKGHDIQKDMEVYGFQVSGLRIEFMTLRYVEGRLLYLERGHTIQLPSILNATTFWTIKKALIQFLLTRQRMEDMANNLEKWIYGKAVEERIIYIASPTFKTPPDSPKLPKRRLV